MVSRLIFEQFASSFCEFYDLFQFDHYTLTVFKTMQALVQQNCFVICIFTNEWIWILLS